MFLLENSRGQRVFVVAIEDWHCFLDNDWSMIKFLIHKMDCAPRDLYSICKRLFLCFKAGERGQQRWMDVENALRKLLHEPGRKQAHVAGHADEVHLALL